jgi:membrane-associated phospholipid phosphatase
MWLDLQRDWFLVVNHFARVTPALHAPLRAYAQYGVVLFAGLLLLTWWFARREQDEQDEQDGQVGRRGSSMAAALWAPAGTLIAVGLNQPLANHVREPRPYTVLPHALVLVARSQDYSFPSDHAVMAGAVATGVLLANRRLGAGAAVAAVLMAFARVYVGAHFPLDVVVGLLLGATVAALGYLAARPLLVPVVSALATSAPVSVRQP